MTPRQLAMTDATFRTILVAVRHEAANAVALVTGNTKEAHRLQADAMERLLVMLEENGYEVVKKVSAKPLLPTGISHVPVTPLPSTFAPWVDHFAPTMGVDPAKDVDRSVYTVVEDGKVTAEWDGVKKAVPFAPSELTRCLNTTLPKPSHSPAFDMVKKYLSECEPKFSVVCMEIFGDWVECTTEADDLDPVVSLPNGQCIGTIIGVFKNGSNRRPLVKIRLNDWLKKDIKAIKDGPYLQRPIAGMEADDPTVITKSRRVGGTAASVMVDEAMAGRCPKCDWPYAASASEGCVPGNCSMREGK